MTLPCLAFLSAAALLGPGDCKAPTNATVVQGVRGYNSWPMVQAMGGRLVCSYSRDRALPADGHGIGAGTRDVYAKVSTDGFWFITDLHVTANCLLGRSRRRKQAR